MPKTPVLAPYGSWKSPISTDLVAAAATTPSSVVIDGDDVYWLETRPDQGGRYTVIQRHPGDSVRELTPPDYNVRTKVHEYGGGAFIVHAGVIYFTNFRDQLVYRQSPGSPPNLIAGTAGCRYADLQVDRARNRLICIREDHRGPGEASNSVVAIDLKGSQHEVALQDGNAFYASARLSPDGTRLAFQTWNHPNMPWDGCELWCADLSAEGLPKSSARVAGGPRESVFQPEWSPNGILHFISDHSGWWNLYRWNGFKVEPLLPKEAEFGRAQFLFNMSQYAFASPSQLLCSYAENGAWRLAWLDADVPRLSPLPTDFTDISDVRCGPNLAAFVAGSPTSGAAVHVMDLRTGKIEPARGVLPDRVDPAYYSLPIAIDFPTTGNAEAHGFYYPPHNPEFAAPQDELPPLLVMSHGGPTSMTTSVLSYRIQFWTSRGFAVLDVNYGGSTGYGRAFRDRLNGKWGIVDVDDCCNGALYLAQTARADRRKLAVRGRSAGGFTTLACLTFRSEVFGAGASLYGVADLDRFAQDTHKFESRYLSSLIGPYPERRDLYLDRSPINSLHKLAAPLILLQGAEDRVVPPSQAQRMYEAVRQKGLAVALLIFEGEQHGFRRASNVKRALEAELYFYSRVFRFALAEDIDPIPIDNL